VVTVPVDVDPDSAREAAVRELADPAYQAAEPSLLEQVLDHVGRFLGNALSTTGGAGLVILLLVGVAVFAVVRLRVGGLTRSRRSASQVFATGRTRPAEDHRRAAELAKARGALSEAVRERFRAIVRELEGRGVLTERSGRTVDEIARTAGQRMPARAGELNAAATLFDDVVYGGRTPTEAEYHTLATLDAHVQADSLVSR
jgi:hypothetical protein